MKAFYTGCRIWIKTVFLNALLFGIGAVFFESLKAFLLAGLLLVVGFIVTLPLLIIIVPLVRLSSCIPYSTKARIVWLFFYLLVLIVVFYAALADVFDGDIMFYQLISTTIAGLFIAVFTTRRSLTNLYNT